MQIRQGDVLLEAVEGVARPAKCQGRAEVVLAEGELTGHAHRLTASVVYDWVANGQRYVQVGEGTGTLQHEEHDPVPASVVPPGTYRVVPQREWGLEEQWKKVTD